MYYQLNKLQQTQIYILVHKKNFTKKPNPNASIIEIPNTVTIAKLTALNTSLIVLYFLKIFINKAIIVNDKIQFFIDKIKSIRVGELVVVGEFVVVDFLSFNLLINSASVDLFKFIFKFL